MEKKQRKYPIAPSRQNKRHIAFHCDIEIVKDLRLLGHETGKIYQELLTEAVVDLLNKYKEDINEWKRWKERRVESSMSVSSSYSKEETTKAAEDGDKYIRAYEMHASFPCKHCWTVMEITKENEDEFFEGDEIKFLDAYISFKLKGRPYIFIYPDRNMKVVEEFYNNLQKEKE